MPNYFPFIIPEFSERKPVRATFRNLLGQQVMATRKETEGYHTITYSFDKITTRQYRIITDHFETVNGGVTSFYVVDWGDPRIVKGVAGDRITLNNITGFSVNAGDGGNNIIIWTPVLGDYGNDSSVTATLLTDTDKAWSVNEWQDFQLMDSGGNEFDISSNQSNSIITTTATLMPGAYEIYQHIDRTVSAIDNANREITLNASPIISYSAWDYFVFPVYECHYSADNLNQLKQTREFNLEANDNYGPFWSGAISFIQKGTG
jgi:hypothetical protein